MKNYPIEKYDFKISKRRSDGMTRVIAITHDCGETIRASATCSPDDNYDVEIGKHLAAARCNMKVAIRRQKRALDKVQETYLDLSAVSRSYDAACDFLRDADQQYEEAKIMLDSTVNKLR